MQSSNGATERFFSVGGGGHHRRGTPKHNRLWKFSAWLYSWVERCPETRIGDSLLLDHNLFVMYCIVLYLLRFFIG